MPSKRPVPRRRSGRSSAARAAAGWPTSSPVTMLGGTMADRPYTEVAVGILVRADGALLLSSRPAGKPYAGYWEFPGGKLEAGETVEQALRRELEEELG